MKKQLTRFLLMLVLVASAFVEAHAQKTMDVAKFTRLDNDLMARVTKPVRDNDEGKLCALIRVVTNLQELNVRADALGIVKEERHNGEVWLYIPYGAKSISFTHEGYYPLVYQYPLSIDEATVYELRLGSYETAVDGGNQNLNTQMFVLSHNPDNATVMIDDIEVPSEFGVFAAMMSRGEHKYKVTAEQYEEAEGTFELADQPVRETVKLHPLFGTFRLLTQPVSGFNVFINGEKAGVSPFKSGRLEPGSYKVRVEKEKYYPKDTIVRLREGDDLLLTTTATSFSDSLFYNRILGGRNISFGINVGYVMPFVSSSAGGGFTGSAINYSLGDSRENVNYTSQSGFTVGLFADIRLYKNLYLTAGVNYTHIKYTNKFNQPIYDMVTYSDENYIYIGDMYNNYEEKYTTNIIEVPILASYRFVLTKYSSLHVNLGPYFAFGLSSKMKLTGSSESEGDIYARWGLVTSPNPVSTYSNDNSHLESTFDMYSKDFIFSRTLEGGITQGFDQKYSRNASPYKRFNYGLKAGVTYELRGFQIGVSYSLQLSNMANSGFWEGYRIPIINGQIGENSMSGYKHRVHSLEFKVGYVLRY